MKEYDDNPKYTVPTSAVPATPKPNYTLKFHKDGADVGTMDFNGSVMVFTGDADASARVFLEALSGAFANRLKEEYERGVKDGAK